MRFHRLIWGCAAILLFTPLMLAGSEKASRTQVEMWVTGDDGLTQRFAEALKAGIRSSSDLAEARTASAKNVKLLVPSNL